MQNLEWYKTLIKPRLTPPDFVFAPVWTILYIMIGVSFFLFIRTGNISAKILPVSFFIIQLILNFSWSPVFFGMHKIKSAFVIICFMWIFILLTIITFYAHSKLAAVLLIPYFLWVTFATYLNYYLLKLNSCCN